MYVFNHIVIHTFFVYPSLLYVLCNFTGNELLCILLPKEMSLSHLDDEESDPES